MSAPPVKKFGDDGVRRGDEENRSFTWFAPAGRRATIYEDVTIDSQPSTHRHVDRDWPMFFADGRGMYHDASTKLASTDWFAFRDPAQTWERSFYQDGSAREREIESAVAHGRDARLFEDFSEEWVQALRDVLQVPSFVSHGLWLATATLTRDCLSDSITHCLAFTAAMYQRHAQALVLYAMDLEPALGEMPVGPAKDRFLEDEAWQPTRRYLERLRTITDWGEIIVAANLVFEPLVNRLLRREMLIRPAGANGDSITPGVLRGAEHEGEWIESWSAALVRFAVEDAEHGEANRAVVQAWLDEWVPEAREAARALAPVFEAMPGGVPFDDAIANVERDLDELLAQAGMTETAEVAS